MTDSFAARLFRAFWKNGDCNAAWGQLLDQQKLGEKCNFFRFDVEYDTAQPALDDVESMDSIGCAAQAAALGSPTMELLAKRARAELFIFELDLSQPPRLVAGAFECVGIVLCRLRARTVEFEEFMRQLQQSSASVKCQGRVVTDSFQPATADSGRHNFSAAFTFRVPTRQHQFEITLDESSSLSVNISGSPFTLEKLIEQQRIGAVFGTSDHRKRPRQQNEAAQRKRTKL